MHLDEHRLYTLPLYKHSSPTAAVVYKNLLYYADNNDFAIHVIDKINGSSYNSNDKEEIFLNDTGNLIVI